MATMQAALSEMNRYGITSAFDAWVGSDDVAVYRQLDKNDKLTVKIRAALAYGYLFTLDRIWSNLTVHSQSLFVDGVLEGETRC